MIGKFRIGGKSFTMEGFRHYIHTRISVVLKTVLVFGAVLAFFRGQYQATVEILLILFITFLPMILSHRFQFRIPHTFEALAVIFIYMALFLGEIQGYYERYWWWDAVLHVGSGFLLGILGFLLVYVLNEKKEIQMHLSAGFMALFAFMFAMGIGALWEIFEFVMDRIFGMNMQKSGLMDTMWDLIIDAVGAFVISFFGWLHLRKSSRDSFLERWIDEFIENNPRLFQDIGVDRPTQPGQESREQQRENSRDQSA